MRLFNRIAIGFLLASTLFQCNDDEITSRNFPRLRTNDVSSITQDGVTLAADIIYRGDFFISSYGFVWSEEQIPIIGSSRIVSFDNNIQESSFSADITSGLSGGTTYYVRAFVITSEFTVYGETVMFTSQGSLAPEIASIFPEKAYLDDTVTITGSNFGGEGAGTKVLFNDVESKIVSVTNSQILCILPGDIDSPDMVVSVRAGGSSVNVQYELLRPEVNSISSAETSFLDTLEITGTHFDLNNERNTVLFLKDNSPTFKANIISSTRDKISFTAPTQLSETSYEVVLNTHLAELPVSQISIKAPRIKDIPDDVTIYENVTIRGEFHPVLIRNRVFINNQEVDLIAGSANVFNGSAGELTFRMPNVPYPDRKAEVRVEMLNLVSESRELNITQDWVMMSNDQSANYEGDYDIFVVDNLAYMLSTKFYRFDQSGKIWSELSAPITTENSFGETYFGAITSNGNKGYYYQGGPNKAFWEFNPTTNQWNRLVSFPGRRSEYPIMFSVDGEIYLGSGVSNARWYKYNISLGSWIRISDLPVTRRFSATFTLGNEAYVVGGTSQEVWKYNAIQDEWTRMSDLPATFWHPTSYILDGIPYVINNDSYYRYNKSSDSWTLMGNTGNPDKGSGSAFVVNGEAYVAHLNQLYQFFND